VTKLARLITATGLATALLSTPAAAAPTLQPLKPCYVSAGEAEERRENVVLRGNGFTPNAVLDVYIDGVLVLTGPSDVVGDLNATVKAPFQRSGEREFGVTVVERANPVNAAGSLSRVTALGVTLRPREARSSRRVRFRGRGFTAAGPVYAHYVFGGKVRRTVRLSRTAAGPCGTFNVRRRQIPIRRPRTGDWTLQIDQQRRYSAEPATNWVRLLIRLREVFVDPGDQATGAGSATAARVRVNRSSPSAASTSTRSPAA
jgi:hypothetical protein